MVINYLASSRENDELIFKKKTKEIYWNSEGTWEQHSHV